MGSKIPFKHGAMPVEVFDLDDRTVRIALGIEHFINPVRPQKRADRYVHYSDGKFGVLETKSSTLRKASLQLGSMAELLLKAGRPVDYLVVVLEDLSSYEREHLYVVRNGILCNARDRKPIPIIIDSRHWQIEVFREQQVDNMYIAHNKLFGGK